MTENPYPIQIRKSILLNVIPSIIIIAIISLIVFIFDKPLSLYIFLFSIIFLLIGIFFRYLYLKSIKYSLDTKNFTFKGGIISRFEKILPYSKIQHVIIYESFWQRIFGLSSISVETARESGLQYGLQSGGMYTGDNSLAGMRNPLIPGLLKEDAEKLKKYIISVSNLKYKPVAGV